MSFPWAKEGGGTEVGATHLIDLAHWPPRRPLRLHVVASSISQYSMFRWGLDDGSNLHLMEARASLSRVGENLTVLACTDPLPDDSYDRNTNSNHLENMI